MKFIYQACAIILAVVSIPFLAFGAIGFVLIFGALALWTSALDKVRIVLDGENVVKFPRGN